MNPLMTTEPDTHRPINERFLAYLDQWDTPRSRRRWTVAAGFVVGVTLTLVAALIALRFQAPVAWVALVVGIAQTARSIAAFRRHAHSRKQFQRVRGVVEHGISVNAYLVRASDALTRPGMEALPCLVLFSFQPEVDGDTAYMRHLTARVRKMQGVLLDAPEDADDPDHRAIAALTVQEQPALYRRRKLPFSFTDGSTIYCADLWVKRAYLKGGYIRRNPVPCLAEPGDAGGIELIPAWLLSESEERAVAGNFPAGR